MMTMTTIRSASRALVCLFTHKTCRVIMTTGDEECSWHELRGRMRSCAQRRLIGSRVSDIEEQHGGGGGSSTDCIQATFVPESFSMLSFFFPYR